METIHFITCLLCACALAFLIYQTSELIKAFKKAFKEDDKEEEKEYQEWLELEKDTMEKVDKIRRFRDRYYKEKEERDK
jgi:cell division protein FtsL